MSWGNIANAGLTPEQQKLLIDTVASQLDRLPLPVKRDRKELEKAARPAVLAALGRFGWMAETTLQAALFQQVVARVGGLGFLNDLLPSADYDPGISEIALNPDGTLWVLPKTEQYFQPVNRTLSLDEVWRAVEALLAPSGRAISESTPSVDAKLPRMEGMGGARIKVIYPNIAQGLGFPAINIRLFEAKPVMPEKLIEWGVAPAAVIHSLVEHVSRKLRVLVIGGTGSGKTTFLSAICSGIPPQARVVKIEDPEEIWLDHPHVVTLEARPASPGSDVPAYTLKNGVDDAMRMSPKWLILGEVRTGDAGLALFRAQMSDHPGLSTFHAEGPEEAVRRMALVMYMDSGVVTAAAKEVFAQAIDIVVQVGWVNGKRQLIGIWEIESMRGGDVKFNQLYAPGDERMTNSSRQRR